MRSLGIAAPFLRFGADLQDTTQPANSAAPPPGWEGYVESLAKHPDVEDAHALAGWMHKRGYKPVTQEGKARDAGALIRRARFDYAKECGPDKMTEAEREACEDCRLESVGLSALGQLARAGVKDVSKRRESAKPATNLTTFTTFCEVSSSKSDDACDVVIITEGAGNKTDRNMYPREALRRSAHVFEGVKCFLDHPSSSDERERPERSVREVCGWFSNCRYAEVNGKGAIVGKLNFTENRAGQDAKDLVKSAVRYQRQYPNSDKVLVGFSINAQGPSRQTDIDGQPWNQVEAIDSAMSADLVTFPARGGRVLSMREAEARKAASIRWRRDFAAALEVA